MSVISVFMGSCDCEMFIRDIAQKGVNKSVHWALVWLRF
jgi:hypothetical protein